MSADAPVVHVMRWSHLDRLLTAATIAVMVWWILRPPKTIDVKPEPEKEPV